MRKAGVRETDVRTAEWTGVGGAEWAVVREDDEAGSEVVGEEARRCPADRDDPAEGRNPTCMGSTTTESSMSIGSTSEGGVEACCCMLETEKRGANGNRVSSKITWREMMMRRVSSSMQR